MSATVPRPVSPEPAEQLQLSPAQPLPTDLEGLLAMEDPQPRQVFSADRQVRRYRSRFADVMEMYATPEQVGVYLDDHASWFRRCAAPMEVRGLGCNGYALTLGRFGNLGFELEPTIGLALQPADANVFRIATIAVPSASSDAYDVNFQAVLRLCNDAQRTTEPEGMAVTRVEWLLDLTIWVRLPGLVTLLPEPLLAGSGDHLLRQIVRRISRRLTWKVQQDFHRINELALPPRPGHRC